MVKRVLLVAMSVVGAGILLILLVKLTAPGTAEQRQVRLSDGRLFRVEAVTFGTNHVVGWGDGWLVPLRKILPSAAVQFLTPTRGQSRQTTDSPTLVVWVHARDASGKYVDCQGVRASLTTKVTFIPLIVTTMVRFPRALVGRRTYFKFSRDVRPN